MRGINTKKAAREFLAPSFSHLCNPFAFSQMQKAVDRIERARARREKVCIYGDYDVDGLCATAILYSYFRYLDMDVRYYIPSRKSEGYGMNIAAIDKLKSDKVNLIITVDNGIVAHNEIAYAYNEGMEVIVTDHHKCPDNPPKCEAVLCHTVHGETYPNKNICGAGTALKLVQAMGGDEAAMQYIPFAGLATMADVVELTGENRAFVYLALKAINDGDCPVGLSALFDVASSGKKRQITERDLSFTFAPRINAAGRMDDAYKALSLLCETDSRKAEKLALSLDELNTQRRTEEQRIIDDCDEQIKDIDLTETRILVLKSENWNHGIVGIAAAKIAERYYRPCILLAESGGILTGSARSIPEIDLYDAMYAFSKMYVKFGGHRAAAGVTMAASHFDEYREKINDYIINTYDYSTFIPKRVYDIDVNLSDITTATADEAEKLAPFGEGNPKPVFLVKNARFQNLQRIGANLVHLNGKIRQQNTVCDFVAFDKGGMFDTLLACDSCDITFTPDISTWGNSKRLQLRCHDFSPAQIEDVSRFYWLSADKFTECYCKNLSARADGEIKLHACSESLLRSTLKSSCDGNLILCTDNESAVYVTNLIKENGCICDISAQYVRNPSFGFNTLCYAPLLSSLDANRYYRIILCGTFTTYQAAYLSQKYPHAQLMTGYISKEISPDAEYFAKATERELMGRVYTYVNKKIKLQPLRPDEIIPKAAEDLSQNRHIISFIIEIFVELGLFFSDNNGRINPNITADKVELSSSLLYTAAREYEKHLILR